MLTDTHCHIDLDKFNPDREVVLERAWQAGVRRILVPSINLSSGRTIVEMVSTRQNLFAAVGVHPTEAGKFSEADLLKLRSFSENSKVKAIGEIGLDYYWNTCPHDTQQEVLRMQLNLAGELGLPVILHFREQGDAKDGACASDLLTILEEWVNQLNKAANPLADHPGVLHSFSGTINTALTAINLGFLLGVTGPVTYNTSRQEIISAVPLESILIETDAPFLAPMPHRGSRNEPANVRLIADKIAMLHSIDFDLCAAMTTSNANQLFHWDE